MDKKRPFMDKTAEHDDLYYSVYVINQMEVQIYASLLFSSYYRNCMAVLCGIFRNYFEYPFFDFVYHFGSPFSVLSLYDSEKEQGQLGIIQ